ncbi:hypothetical protein ON010_g13496 [Phytophthora cinnamomi]|nr:hypothetical protein ON010_g13496 [Phytophthora cinnamomi]
MGVSRKGSSVLLDPSDVLGKPEKLNINNSKRMVQDSVPSQQFEADAGPEHDRADLAAKSTCEQPLSATGKRKVHMTTIDDVDISHREHTKLLWQALQLVFAPEVLVFAEYAELFAPFCMGCTPLCFTACRTPSTT